VILRFDYTTVAAIAVLFGVFFVLPPQPRSDGECGDVIAGWRVLHWLLAALFIVVGVSRSSDPKTRSSVWRR
jgi:hypothetical protein